MTPLVEENLTEVLRGRRSVDDAKFILRVQEDGPAQEAEFDEIYARISKKLPGVAFDFEKLLSDDPIENDPLIAQGNLTILRLDTLYHESYKAWTNSGGMLHFHKTVTKPGSVALRTDSTNTRERSEKTYPPDSDLINQSVEILLTAFRVQATITHRREILQNPEASNQKVAFRSAKERSADSQVSRDATRSADPPQQETTFETIDPIQPIDGKIPLIQGITKLGILKGYEGIEGLIKTAKHSSQASCSVKAHVPSPNIGRVPCSDDGTPASEHAESSDTNKVSRQDYFSVISASPCEQPHFTHNQPAFHKRE
jgi:hypothetical protein